MTKRYRLLASCALASSLVFTQLASKSLGAEEATSEKFVLGTGKLLTGIPGKGPLTSAQIKKWLADPKNHETLEFELPEGLAAGSANIYIPEDNPLTPAKIELGRQLYFDTRLSSDNTISCASCHAPATGYAANTRFGIGVKGQQGGRNSPVAYNRILSRAQFWDGRAASLEDQAIGPIANPIEMSNTHPECVSTISGIPGYTMQFAAIFPDGLTIENVGKAIASFERAVVTGPAPYDKWAPLDRFEQLFADDLADLKALQEEDPEMVERYEALKKVAAESPMSEAAIRGVKLFFGKANCATCHAGANFTDEQYHNLGVGMDAAKPDLGRAEISKEEALRGAFKTPTLRNIAQTSPYMHDGSQKTLEEVMVWYNKGGHKNQWLSDKMKPLQLTEQEIADLVEFMAVGLTGPFPEVETGRLPQ